MFNSNDPLFNQSDPRMGGSNFRPLATDPNNGQDLLTMLSQFHTQQEMNNWNMPAYMPPPPPMIMPKPKKVRKLAYNWIGGERGDGGGGFGGGGGSQGGAGMGGDGGSWA